MRGALPAGVEAALLAAGGPREAWLTLGQQARQRADLGAGKMGRNTPDQRRQSPSRGAMRLMAGVVLLGASTLGAQAHFDAAAMGDWPDHKRELCYRFDKAENYANGKPDVGDDPVWVLWIEKAVKNWNDKLGGAWKLRPCTDKDKTDFIFTFSSGAETSGQGGAATGPTPFTNAAKPIKIKIRPDVTDQRIEMADGTFAAPQGGRFVNGKDTGWSKVGPKALDPVLVIMHELGHIMRLNHTVKAEKQGDLQFPVKLGQHENVPGSRSRAPSAADITHAKTAASSIAFVPRLTLEPWFGAGGLLGNSDASYVSTGNQEPFKKSVSESSGHACGGLELGVSPFSLDGSVCTRRESRLFAARRSPP
jgi:hypothetical protein